MTTIAQALRTVSLGLAELAEALEVEPKPNGPQSSIGRRMFPERVTDAPTPTPIPSPLAEVLGECPIHQTPWQIKEGGISRAGKAYKAFWKCDGKMPDGTFCQKKPTLEWVRTHDPEAVPF